MTEPSDAAGIVLAGGRASRFGSDKLVAELDGRPLIGRAVAAVAAVVPLVILVTDPGGERPVEPPSGARLVTTSDAVPYGGPLSGLDAGLAAAIEVGADRVVLVGGDMPTLQPSLLSALLGLVAPEGVEGAAPVVDGVRRPLPCALRVAETAAALGQLATSPDRSLRALLARLRVVDLEEIEWRRLDPGGRSFVDVDRPGDLERATDAPPTSDPETR